MGKLSKRHFWEWFNRNNQEYLNFDNKTKKENRYWLQELNAHLRAYFKFLGFSLALNEEGIGRLTISVNGNAKHFKRVDAFVATAPAIPGWIIRALDEPAPIDYTLEKQITSAGIHPAELTFHIPNEDQDCVDVTVYHPLCTPFNEHQLLGLAYAAIYNVLGERSFGLDVRSVTMMNLSESEGATVHPLEELANHIGQRNSSMMVDHNGTLLNL
jgi:hypothetical protein